MLEQFSQRHRAAHGIGELFGLRQISQTLVQLAGVEGLARILFRDSSQALEKGIVLQRELEVLGWLSNLVSTPLYIPETLKKALLLASC